MIELANTLLCGLQRKAMRCITHLQTHFCIIRDDPSCGLFAIPGCHTRMRLADGTLFFDAWQRENGYVCYVEKAPASWEAGDILQTRPAGLVV